MSRATEEKLDDLHQLVARALLEQLQAYRAQQQQNTPTPPAIPASFMAQVLKFLKDNGIDVPARAQGMADALRGLLPEFQDNQGTKDT